MESNIVLFSKICDVDELKCLICTYENDSKKECSMYHQRILKCRMIIFTIPQILASPNPEHKYEILLLFHENVSDEMKLREELAKIKINVFKKVNVNPAMLELCFKYTLEAKISPFWNAVDNVLVKGRNFLLESAPLDAVDIKIYVTENMLRLEINCYKIMLKQFDIKDLEVSNNVIDYFSNVFDAKLSNHSLCEQWVHVLPRLTKARIMSVDKKMPKSAHFDSYKELRRHWKNIYGYRLPDFENDLLFYGVHFRPFGSELYTYPSICLRSQLPLKHVPPPQHKNNIIQTFLKDFKFQFPGVFGLSVDFDHNDPLSTTIPYLNINGIPNPLIIPREAIPDKIDSVQAENNIFTQNLSLCTPLEILSPKDSDTKKYFPIFHPKNIKPIQNTPTHNKSTNINKIETITEDKMRIVSNGSSTSIDDKILPIVPKFIAKKPIYPNVPSTVVNKNRLNISPESQSILSENVNTTFMSQFPSQSIPNESNGKLNNCEEIASQQNKTEIFNHFKSIKAVNNIDDKTTSISAMKDSQVSKENMSQEQKAARKRKRPEVDLSKVNEVPLLMKNDPEKLKKINKDTIAAWLKSQNVTVTTKMTKLQLLAKLTEIVNK